jgi:hypothetical protein
MHNSPNNCMVATLKMGRECFGIAILMPLGLN